MLEVSFEVGVDVASGWRVVAVVLSRRWLCRMLLCGRAGCRVAKQSDARGVGMSVSSQSRARWRRACRDGTTRAMLKLVACRSKMCAAVVWIELDVNLCS